MWQIASETEDALWAAAKSLLGDAPTRRKSLVRAIAERSARYTVERESIGGRQRESKEDLAARALFFTLADAAKIMIPIAELGGRDALPSGDPIRVLDVGAGCGAMTFGLLEALPERALEIQAVDRDGQALQLFSAAFAELDPARATLDIRTSDLTKTKTSERDLIVCGSALNELEEDAARRAALSLIESLSDDGVLVVIEPALRETSRRLHRLRDAVISADVGHVFAPCTRAASPCPALANERDWCHEDHAFQATPRLASLTNATGMRMRRLKFSYLVVTRADVNVAPRDGLLRIVSGLKKSKGQSELYGCGDSGWQKLRLQKRDRSPQNRAFEKAQRGQLLGVGEGTYEVIDPTG